MGINPRLLSRSLCATQTWTWKLLKLVKMNPQIVRLSQSATQKSTSGSVFSKTEKKAGLFIHVYKKEKEKKTSLASLFQ